LGRSATRQKNEREIMKYSREELEALVSIIAQDSLELGILKEGERLEFQMGVPSAGIAFRLFGNNGNDLFRCANGYLGWSKEEAANTLRGISGALQAAKNAKYRA
jgi:hypothetical protein